MNAVKTISFPIMLQFRHAAVKTPRRYQRALDQSLPLNIITRDTSGRCSFGWLQP
jgi:hypothetical protein